MIVSCAVCDARRDLPMSDEVYPDGGPFDPPEPIPSGTGWRGHAGLYFCPDHLDAPSRYAETTAGRGQRRDEEIAHWSNLWDLAHPWPDLAAWAREHGRAR